MDVGCFVRDTGRELKALHTSQKSCCSYAGVEPATNRSINECSTIELVCKLLVLGYEVNQQLTIMQKFSWFSFSNLGYFDFPVPNDYRHHVLLVGVGWRI